MLKILGSVVLILLVVLAVLLGYRQIVVNEIAAIKQYSYSPILVATQNETQQTESSVSTEIKADENDIEWISYIQPDDKYSFLYPKDWYIQACSNGYYSGNLHLDPEPLEDECISVNPPQNFPLISIFATKDKSVDQIVEETEKQLPSIAFDFIHKKAIINDKEYKQTVFLIKLLPPGIIDVPTIGVSTYVDFPDKNQVVLVSLGGLDDDSKEADIYRQVISSIEKLD